MRHLTFLLLTVISVIPSTARADVRYRVTNMTEIWMEAIALPDEITSIGGGRLNNHGQITGTYNTVDGGRHAFIWDPDTGLKDLGNLGQDHFTIAYAINNNSQVVGQSMTDISVSEYGHAFLWCGENDMRDLGSFGRASYANDINDYGQVVGASWYDENTGNDYSHAFLWTEEGGIQHIGVEGEKYSTARAINNSGQIITYVQMPDEEGIESIIREPDGEIHNLGSLLEFRAQGINDNGLVVGTGYNVNDITILRTWSEEDGFRDLETIGDGYVETSCINNGSQIAGGLHVYDDDGSSVVRAFLWEEATGMQYLDDLVPSESPWTINRAGFINDNGLIMAIQYSPDGNHVYLLLTPIPEPTVIAMLVTIFFAYGLCLFRHQRRTADS